MAKQVAGCRDGRPSAIVLMTRCSVAVCLCATDQVNMSAGLRQRLLRDCQASTVYLSVHFQTQPLIRLSFY